MKPVYQSIIHEERGDCMRAALASMFELELEQVPHFVLYPNPTFHEMYKHFLEALGYRQHVVAYPHALFSPKLATTPLVNGCIYAGVESRTVPGCAHAVLVNRAGVVLHDPNPNGKFKGVNVANTGELICWHVIVPIVRRPWFLL